MSVVPSASDAAPIARGGAPIHEDAAATLTRILGAIEEYVYTGEFLADDGYRVVFAGPCRERFLGMSIDEARTAVWKDYVHPQDVATFDEAHDGAHRTGRLDVEYRLIGADGCVRWVRDRGMTRTEHGRRFLDGSILDVTAIRSAHEALEAARAEALRASQVDPLTGVFNRRSLASRLAELRGRAIGVLSLDVDHFKHINDFYGHAAGDRVLVEVTERVRRATRRGDAIFRMGGEEFLVLLHDVRDDAVLRRVGEAIRNGIWARPVLAGDEAIEVTVSIGGATTRSLSADFDELLAAADRAMYGAKRGGRDRVHVGADDAAGDEVGDGIAVRIAEAMAALAAVQRGASAARPAARARLAVQVARRSGASPAQVLRCRLALLLLDVASTAEGEAVIGAVAELRPVLAILRDAGAPGADAAPSLETRVVAAVRAGAGIAAGPAGEGKPASR